MPIYASMLHLPRLQAASYHRQKVLDILKAAVDEHDPDRAALAAVILLAAQVRLAHVLAHVILASSIALTKLIGHGWPVD